MEFIDLNQENLGNYGEELKVMKKDPLPITFIQGKPVFLGKVDYYKAYLTLKKLRQKMSK